MGTQYRALLVLVVFFGAWGCMAPTVRTDYDPAADFTAFRTYKFAGMTALSHRSLLDNSLVRKRIEQMVGEQLTSKGLRQVGAEEPSDLLVHYWVAVNEKHRIQGGGPYWRGGLGGVSSYQYEEGTLIVDLETPAKKELVWRGSIVGVLGDSKEDNMRMMHEALAKAFQDYPPGSKHPR